MKLRPDWPHALAFWRETGRTSIIEELIRAGEPVPEDQRQLLADIVAGRAKRTGARGPRKTDAQRVHEAEVRLAFAQQLAIEQAAQGKEPSETATERVALQFGISADVVNRIVYPRRRQRAN